LRFAQGQIPAALTAMLECGRHQDAAGIVNPAFTPWRSHAALAHLSLGHLSEAVELAEQELDLSRRWGTPRTIGVSLRCLGLVRGGREGTELLTEAVTELERSPARTELARTLGDLGVALVRDGYRDTGQETLRRGLGLAEQCGANGLAAQIRDALRGTGARPRRPRAAGHPVLTPSEYQVASKAALGQTNREIAQLLFVTPRTVEIHLTSAYRKLGIPGRRQLREALSATTPRFGWMSAPDGG
jgi:DNA-binding CsgD family transcriptional regulator